MQNLAKSLMRPAIEFSCSTCSLRIVAALNSGCSTTSDKVATQSGAPAVQELGLVVHVRKGFELLNATEDSGYIVGILLGGGL